MEDIQQKEREAKAIADLIDADRHQSLTQTIDTLGGRVASLHQTIANENQLQQDQLERLIRQSEELSVRRAAVIIPDNMSMYQHT